MKNVFKTTPFLLLATIAFLSCNSNDVNEEIITDQQQTTTTLK